MKIIFIMIACLQLQLSLAHSTTKDHTCFDGECSDSTFSLEYDGSWQTTWEGKCAQVAASNLLSMACGEQIKPDLLEWYSWDLTPGSRPSTIKAMIKSFLKNASDKHCHGLTDYRLVHRNIKQDPHSESITQGQFINKLHYHLKENLDDRTTVQRIKRTTIRQEIPAHLRSGMMLEDTYETKVEIISRVNPVISCISSNGYGHYVTIVDVTNIFDKYGDCEVVYNQWGEQHRENCMDFAKKANMKGGVYSRVSGWFCGKYSIFTLEENE
jgi:hypothetical protein